MRRRADGLNQLNRATENRRGRHQAAARETEAAAGRRKAPAGARRGAAGDPTTRTTRRAAPDPLFQVSRRDQSPDGPRRPRPDALRSVCRIAHRRLAGRAPEVGIQSRACPVRAAQRAGRPGPLRPGPVFPGPAWAGSVEVMGHGARRPRAPSAGACALRAAVSRRLGGRGSDPSRVGPLCRPAGQPNRARASPPFPTRPPTRTP